jgi:hypothetical protein
MHHIILSLFHQQKIKQNNLRGVNPVFLKLFSYQNLSPNFQLANDLPIMQANVGPVRPPLVLISERPPV